MMCGQRRAEHDQPLSWERFAPGPPARGPAEAPRSPDERVGDTERERSAALVSRAYAEGLLRADELDDRLGHIYGAVTAGDLDAATALLPAGWREQVAREERDARRAQLAGEWWRRSVAAYLGVMVLLVGIWLTVALTAGAWYPWPVWPALGWGIPLALGRPRRWGRGSGRALPADDGSRGIGVGLRG